MGKTTYTWYAREVRPNYWMVYIDREVGGVHAGEMHQFPVEVMRARDMRRAANTALALWKIKEASAHG